MPAIDQDLRTLAAVSEAVGDDRLEVVGAQVESTDDVCGSVAVEGELFDGGIPDGIRVTACDCSIADSGAIRLELTVERTADDTPDESASTPSVDEIEDDDTETTTATDPAETTARRDGGEVVTSASDATAPASTTTVEGIPPSGDDEEGEADHEDEVDDADDVEDVDDPAEVGAEPPVGDETRDTDEESEGSERDADADADGTDSSLPYRDPERLAEVYDSEDTFAEMTDALGVDVTPQTVRRYMIEHGIHEPRSQPAIGPEDAERLETTSTAEADDDAVDGVETEDDAGADIEPDDDDASGDAGSPDEPASSEDPDDQDDVDPLDESKETEGAGEIDGETTSETEESSEPDPLTSTVDEAIPLTDVCDVDGAEDHTLGELIDAAVGARTMYEVQSTLGVDPETTRALLEACDLTDLVTGRIDRGEGPDELDVRDRVAGALADGHH